MKTKIYFLLFLVFHLYKVEAQYVELRTDSTIIGSKLRIKNHSEAVGKVLTSDAKGNASWQNPSGGGANWQVVQPNSVRAGFNTQIADGTSNTILIGESSTASAGQYLYGLGWGHLMSGYGTTFLGNFNEQVAGSITAWQGSDPLFVLGNGQSEDIRSNAVIVSKEGRVGINRTFADLGVVNKKLQVAGGAYITGGIQLPTGAASGKYLKSDASGNATWAGLPSFDLSLPYSGQILSPEIALQIINTDVVDGHAIHSDGNLLLTNINEKEGYILTAIDGKGEAKWQNGNCVNRCSFSWSRGGDDNVNLAANIKEPFHFTQELFDLCDASSTVNPTGENPLLIFTAPLDGVYQFSFLGRIKAGTVIFIGIHTLNAANLPNTELFRLSVPIGSSEETKTFTALLNLKAGDKIAPTVFALSNNSAQMIVQSAGVDAQFSGFLVQSIDCKNEEKK